MRPANIARIRIPRRETHPRHPWTVHAGLQALGPLIPKVARQLRSRRCGALSSHDVPLAPQLPPRPLSVLTGSCGRAAESKVPGDDDSHMRENLEGVGIGCGEFVQYHEEFNRLATDPDDIELFLGFSAQRSKTQERSTTRNNVKSTSPLGYRTFGIPLHDFLSFATLVSQSCALVARFRPRRLPAWTAAI
jgi:hypothetical protein